MARLKVVAICATAPVGLAVVALIVCLAGGFGAASSETATRQTALLIRASCKTLRPPLPTSLGLAVLRHLRS